MTICVQKEMSQHLHLSQRTNRAKQGLGLLWDPLSSKPAEDLIHRLCQCCEIASALPSTGQLPPHECDPTVSWKKSSDSFCLDTLCQIFWGSAWALWALCIQQTVTHCCTGAINRGEQGFLPLNLKLNLKDQCSLKSKDSSTSTALHKSWVD